MRPANAVWFEHCSEASADSNRALDTHRYNRCSERYQNQHARNKLPEIAEAMGDYLTESRKLSLKPRDERAGRSVARAGGRRTELDLTDQEVYVVLVDGNGVDEFVDMVKCALLAAIEVVPPTSLIAIIMVRLLPSHPSPPLPSPALPSPIPFLQSIFSVHPVHSVLVVAHR